MNYGLNRRHHDDEIVDSVRIEAVPRLKTSALSGDEWRVSYRVRLTCKGVVLYDHPYQKLADATAHLPWVMRTMFEGGLDGFDERAWIRYIDEEEDHLCHQVGCAARATVFYRLKETFARDGEGPLPANTLPFRVAFCESHSERGNAGREDSDRNYERIRCAGCERGAPEIPVDWNGADPLFCLDCLDSADREVPE